jgi:hypothetical protein
MDGCKSMLTPMTTNFRKLDASEFELVDPTLYLQLIGSLMYLVNTRPDISFVVNILSQFIVEPRRVQWSAAKHVLRYVVGTVDYGLDYVRGDGVGLVGYSDLDFRVLFRIGFGCSFLVQQEAKVGGIELGRGRVHGG